MLDNLNFSGMTLPTLPHDSQKYRSGGAEFLQSKSSSSLNNQDLAWAGDTVEDNARLCCYSQMINCHISRDWFHLSGPGILMSPLIADRYKYGDTLTGGMGPICPQHIQKWKWVTVNIRCIMWGGLWCCFPLPPAPFVTFTLVKSCLDFQSTLNLNVFTRSLLIWKL